MKNVFTKIHNVRLQTSQKTGESTQIYFSLKDRVKVFTENIKQNTYEFKREFIIDDDDEILNFHIYGEHLVLIARNSKKLFLYNKSGEKLKEL